MKISFLQSGGFAGLTKSAEIDFDKLSADQGKRFRSLVEESKFFDTPDFERSALPDEEQYTITIATAERTREIRLGRSTIPPALEPLIEYIGQFARFRKKIKSG